MSEIATRLVMTAVLVLCPDMEGCAPCSWYVTIRVRDRWGVVRCRVT